MFRHGILVVLYTKPFNLGPRPKERLCGFHDIFRSSNLSSVIYTQTLTLIGVVCFQETKHGPFTAMSHAVGAGLETLKVDPEVAESPGPGPLASIELKPIVSH